MPKSKDDGQTYYEVPKTNKGDGMEQPHSIFETIAILVCVFSNFSMAFDWGSDWQRAFAVNLVMFYTIGLGMYFGDKFNKESE